VGVIGLIGVGLLFGQTAPPLVPADDPVPLVQAEPVATQATVGAGYLGYSSSAGLAADAGGYVSIGKPLYVGDRHPHHQWVTDSTIFISYSPGTRTTQLIVAPTIGTNFYFGPFFGLEWRAGLGVGVTPGAVTNAGLGISLESGLVVRPFADDQKRIKLMAQQAFFGGLTSSLSLTSTAIGLGFEIPL
jgi:hypothetical protein